MRSVGLALVCLLFPVAAWAEDQEDEVPSDLPRLINDSGRVEHHKAEDDRLKIQLHGEYQIRGQLQRSYPMDATLSFRNDNPGAREVSHVV